MKRTTIAFACSALVSSAPARIAPGPEGPGDGSNYTATVPGISFDLGTTFGGAFAGAQVTLPAPSSPTGYISDIFGMGSGGRDAGKFLCQECTIGNNSADLRQLNDLISSQINAFLTTNMMWKLGDNVTICNGSWCVTMVYSQPMATQHWIPKVAKTLTQPDNRKGYKNPNGFPAPGASVTPDSNTTLYSGRNPSTGQTVWIGFTTLGPKGAVTSGPLVIAPNSGGGSGSDSCVHVDSRLANGQRAGDVVAGDYILLGDERLQSRSGIVLYSQKKTALGWRIMTQSGASLVCSETAPILTPEGYMPAPSIAGLMIAVRREDGETGWERVEVLESVGMIEIQHISVGGQAFWAGERADAYILHHNKEALSPQAGP